VLIDFVDLSRTLGGRADVSFLTELGLADTLAALPVLHPEIENFPITAGNASQIGRREK